MPPKKQNPDAASEKTEGTDIGPTVVVMASQATRWRIGRKFGPEPVSIPAEELTEEDIDALKADPVLVVTFVDAPY